LTATSATAVSYKWDDGSTLQHSVQLHSKYCVTITDGNGVRILLAVILRIILSICSVNDVTVCTDYMGTLTATSATAVSYLWDNGSTLSTFSSTTPGKYCVTITDGNGCKNSACGNIKNYPVPSVSVNDVTVCTGYMGTLTATSATAVSYLLG